LHFSLLRISALRYRLLSASFTHLYPRLLNKHRGRLPRTQRSAAYEGSSHYNGVAGWTVTAPLLRRTLPLQPFRYNALPSCCQHDAYRLRTRCLPVPLRTLPPLSYARTHAPTHFTTACRTPLQPAPFAPTPYTHTARYTTTRTRNTLLPHCHTGVYTHRALHAHTHRYLAHTHYRACIVTATLPARAYTCPFTHALPLHFAYRCGWCRCCALAACMFTHAHTRTHTTPSHTCSFCLGFPVLLWFTITHKQASYLPPLTHCGFTYQASSFQADSRRLVVSLHSCLPSAVGW